MVFERYILTFESFKSTEIIKASFIDGNWSPEVLSNTPTGK